MNVVHHRINHLECPENGQINVRNSITNLFENIELDVAIIDASEINTYNMSLGSVVEHDDINTNTPSQRSTCWNSTV